MNSVPAPPFPGNPLDPPLRSRFQARHISRVPTEALMHVLYANNPTVSATKMNRLVSLYEAIHGLGALKIEKLKCSKLCTILVVIIVKISFICSFLF